MKTITDEQIDTIGSFADTIDNLVAASHMRMPAEFHLSAIRESLVDLSEKINFIYAVLSKQSEGAENE